MSLRSLKSRYILQSWKVPSKLQAQLPKSSGLQIYRPIQGLPIPYLCAQLKRLFSLPLMILLNKDSFCTTILSETKLRFFCPGSWWIHEPRGNHVWWSRAIACSRDCSGWWSSCSCDSFLGCIWLEFWTRITLASSLAVMLVLAAVSVFARSEFSEKVVRVIDGNTITVLAPGNQQVNARLYTA